MNTIIEQKYLNRLNAYASGSNYFIEQSCYPTANVYFRKAFESLE